MSDSDQSRGLWDPAALRRPEESPARPYDQPAEPEPREGPPPPAGGTPGPRAFQPLPRLTPPPAAPPPATPPPAFAPQAGPPPGSAPPRAFPPSGSPPPFAPPAGPPPGYAPQGGPPPGYAPQGGPPGYAPQGGPPGYAPPSGPPPGLIAPAPAGSRRTWQFVAGAAVAGALAVAVVTFVVMPRDAGPAQPPAAQTGGQAANAETPFDAAPAETEPAFDNQAAPATESASAQDEALAELEEIYQGDLGTVGFNGQFVAQLSSKYPGIVDQLQFTEGGSNTFQATDILAEHQRLRSENGDAEHPVILLKSTDYGKRRTDDGNFYWMTFAVGDFPDRQSVRDWCATQFAALSEAERANQCVVGRLRPPE